MKAQMGIEFVVLTSLLLVIISIFLYSSYSKQAELINIKTENELKDLLDAASFEINAAVKAGDGYERSFNMNIYTTLSQYNMEIHGNEIILVYGKWSMYKTIITRDVVGNFTKDFNRIKNVGGTIYVN
ncbi:MAG: hypothetical protein QXM68_02425 [Candidatus Aenigmatarchaeota archaeon]|nr:hypothetical protein [Candidatus Aenigmarchaeota archaeon]